METRGRLAPEDEAALREWWAATGTVAQTVTREATRAMGFDRDEYEERVTPDVVGTAHEAAFASLLAVEVGDRAAYETALADADPADVTEHGSQHVDRVAWHVAPVADAAVAATFQDEADAAVATLRRQAMGGLYRPLLADLGLVDGTPGPDADGQEADT
ncbi:MAG: DUF5809 family protein [Halobacteriaceae archaeon]